MYSNYMIPWPRGSQSFSVHCELMGLIFIRRPMKSFAGETNWNRYQDRELDVAVGPNEDGEMSKSSLLKTGTYPQITARSGRRPLPSSGTLQAE